MKARRRKASALRLRFSQSLAGLRQRLSQARVRSTIQRLGRTTKPLAWSERLTMSTQDVRHGLLKFGSLITAIGIELEQEREHAEQGGEQQHPAVAILEVGGMNDRVQQQPLRIYQDMALLPSDLLACVITGRVDRGPPFSALLTLWLSMIAAVGLASRPACSRHCT